MLLPTRSNNSLRFLQIAVTKNFVAMSGENDSKFNCVLWCVGKLKKNKDSLATSPEEKNGYHMILLSIFSTVLQATIYSNFVIIM